MKVTIIVATYIRYYLIFLPFFASPVFESCDNRSLQFKKLRFNNR